MKSYFLIFIWFLLNGEIIKAEERVAKKNTAESHAKFSDNIVVLNIDKLLHESKAAKQFQIDIENHRAKIQDEIQKREDKFIVLEKELIEQQKTLKPEIFTVRRKEFEAKVTELQQLVAQRREQLEMASNEVIEKIHETILSLVRDKAIKHNYKLVIPRNFVIFQVEGLEITDEIMKDLDLQLPFVLLKLPQD